MVDKSSKKQPSSEESENQSGGAPFNDQDPKRRLGNFGGAGEHPRKGGRTTGIVGQNKEQNGTDRVEK